MAVSILEALQNAKYNILEGSMPFQLAIGKEQLKNAVTLLEKGYDLDTQIEPLLEKHESVDNVPDNFDNW